MKDRLPELKENVSFISLRFFLKTIHFGFQVEIYGNGEDLSIINHFAVIDMEGPFMGDFFYKVKNNNFRNILHSILIRLIFLEMQLIN
jgi:hypothetical protein